MRVYKRGDKFPTEFDNLFTSKASRLKYWLVGENGKPSGSPFLRRSDIDLYEVTQSGEYQIISSPVGRPPSGKTAQKIKAEHDLKRAQDPARKAKMARYARDRRARQKRSKQAED